jgi:hypothetical protein
MDHWRVLGNKQLAGDDVFTDVEPEIKREILRMTGAPDPGAYRLSMRMHAGALSTVLNTMTGEAQFRPVVEWSPAQVSYLNWAIGRHWALVDRD